MSRASVYTPATLAERWACSERQVRLMIERGDLPAFRLGGKLIRIRQEDVEAYECPNGGSPDCEANSASPGMTHPSPAGADVIALERVTPKRRPASPRLDTQSLRGRAARR